MKGSSSLVFMQKSKAQICILKANPKYFNQWGPPGHVVPTVATAKRLSPKKLRPSLHESGVQIAHT